MAIYLDNAATSPVRPEVLEEMLPFFYERFGNPSSIHSFGRDAKTTIELCRKKLAALLQCKANELYFTSGGTESDNLALQGAVRDLGVQRIISSPLEHHAVLHTLDFLQTFGVEIQYVNLLAGGEIDLQDLKQKLASSTKKTLVSLMHANNEVGNLLPLEEVAAICTQYQAYFHSDTVQTIGHFKLNFGTEGLHFATASAHKFHGPKGIGLLYMSHKLRPFFHGGAQEKSFRAGTENVAGIVGMTKALELAYTHLEKDKAYISSLKTYLIALLKEKIPGIAFNGQSESMGKALYNVVNIRLPKHDKGDMLLFALDLESISVSGGSACASGSLQGSHVLNAIHGEDSNTSIRVSLSTYNTTAELDKFVEILAKQLTTV